MFLAFSLVFSVFGSVYSICPHGWVQHAESCYHVSSEPATWVDAMRMCELHNGRLADILSSSEQWYLHYQLMYRYRPADYWVGGTDWENEGEWIWEGSQKNVTYTHWLPGQPNNGRAPYTNPTSGNAEFQNCLSLRYQDDFSWVDSVCSEHLHYICEKHASVPATAAPYYAYTHTTPTFQPFTTTTGTPSKR